MWAEPLLCGVQPRGGGSAEMEIWFPALCSTHSLLQGECFHSNAITGMLRGVAEIQTHSFRVLTRQRQTFIVGSESSVVGGISQRVAPPLCHAPTVSNIVLRTGTGRQHGAQPRTAKCRGRGLDENSPPPHSSTCKNYINKSDPLAFPWVSSRAVKQTLFKCFSKSSEMSQHLQLKVDVMMEHHNEGKKETDQSRVPRRLLFVVAGDPLHHDNLAEQIFVLSLVVVLFLTGGGRRLFLLTVKGKESLFIHSVNF